MRLRTVVGFVALAAAGAGVSAGAIAFANTLATHQPPQASDVRRLADVAPADLAPVDLAAVDGRPEFPAANAEAKSDRLPVALAAPAPAQPAVPPSSDGLPNLAEATARAYAALEAAPEANSRPTGDAEVGRTAAEKHNSEKAAEKAAAPAKAKATRPKPSNVLLNDAQIAALKQRLRLSPSQEQMWPEIEAALRAVLHQIYETNRKAHGATVPVDTSTPEVERLKTAALPFLMQMRPDQKTEIITLARVIGMEKLVAAL